MSRAEAFALPIRTSGAAPKPDVRWGDDPGPPLVHRGARTGPGRRDTFDAACAACPGPGRRAPRRCWHGSTRRPATRTPGTSRARHPAAAGGRPVHRRRRAVRRADPDAGVVAEPEDWRVDKLLATGETDSVHARRLHDDVGLRGDRRHPDRDPRSGCRGRPTCCRPSSSAGCCRRRRPDELTRLAARRVAGRDALGLRVAPGGAAVQHRPRRPVGGSGDGRSRCASRSTPRGRRRPRSRRSSVTFSDEPPDADVTRFTRAAGCGRLVRRRARHRGRGQPVRADRATPAAGRARAVPRRRSARSASTVAA